MLDSITAMDAKFVDTYIISKHQKYMEISMKFVCEQFLTLFDNNDLSFHQLYLYLT
jgi:hypothetical protein